MYADNLTFRKYWDHVSTTYAQKVKTILKQASVWLLVSQRDIRDGTQDDNECKWSKHLKLCFCIACHFDRVTIDLYWSMTVFLPRSQERCVLCESPQIADAKGVSNNSLVPPCLITATPTPLQKVLMNRRSLWMEDRWPFRPIWNLLKQVLVSLLLTSKGQ